MTGRKNEMKAFPQSFADKVAGLAEQARGWAVQRAKGETNARSTIRQLRHTWEMKDAMVGEGVLDEQTCLQLFDMAIGACGVHFNHKLKLEGFKKEETLFENAANKRPKAVSAELWLKTWQLLLAAAAAGCANVRGDAAEEAKQKKICDRRSRDIAGLASEALHATPSQAPQEIPAHVLMFSGCKDSQTSADVDDTYSFGIPGGHRAGGACTSALIKALGKGKDFTWVALLSAMRKVLKEGRFEQIPELSSSRDIDLQSPFSVKHADSKRCRALLVGLNYPHTSAELSGCHNDVDTMKKLLLDRGYREGDMRIMTDSPRSSVESMPTLANMETGMKWLVEGAESGDSLFFHYSGHGTNLLDLDGDEEDGRDEALCPSDFQTAGFLRDDRIFQLLVTPLKEGTYLTCVLDCCHSGTVLDLPYTFKAEDESGKMKRNLRFSVGCEAA